MATCRSCQAEVQPGIRWCTMCHTSLAETGGRLASPGKRLGAYVLDVVIPFAAIFIMIGVAGAGAASGSSGGLGLGFFSAFAMLIAYAVWALMLFAKGTTPGKNILGMRVVKENGETAGFGTMLVREWIGKLISGMLLSLGFLWILFDRDRQGWHDKLASTFVVE